jgi:hypothetical protein
MLSGVYDDGYDCPQHLLRSCKLLVVRDDRNDSLQHLLKKCILL